MFGVGRATSSYSKLDFNATIHDLSLYTIFKWVKLDFSRERR